MGRALARHVDAHAPGPCRGPHHHGQSRTMAGSRTPRDHRAGPVDPSDLCCLGRCGGPDVHRCLCPKARRFADRTGKPISPRTKAHFLMASRTFFRDCQEWEWFPRRFDPSRAMALPRSVAALIGTNPRVIADEVWAKLLWAGLNLQEDDLLTWELGLLPNRTGPRRYLDLAVRWASQRRDSSAASRLCPLATRWLSHIGRLAKSSSKMPCACWTCPATRPAPRSPNRSTHCSARPSSHGKH